MVHRTAGFSRTGQSDRDQLHAVVKRVRNRWRLRLALRGLALTIIGLVLLLILAGYGVDVLRFDPTAVSILRVIVYLALAATAVRYLILPMTRRVTDEQVALYLEEHEPTLGGRVLAAVASPDEHHSGGLIEALVQQAAAECHRIQDGDRIDRRGLRQSTGLVAGSTVLGLGVILLGPSFLRNTTPVLLQPWREATTFNPYAIAVTPGDTVMPRGADLKINAQLRNFDAADVRLYLKAASAEEWTEWAMLTEDSTGHALMVFDLTERTEYYVEAGGVRSPEYAIEVVELPYVRDITLEYRFPAYTGLGPQVQEGSGDIAALTGTRVTVAVSPTIPVPGGALVIDGSDTTALVPAEGGEWSAELTVREAGSYRILLDSDQGRRVTASPDYLIDPLTDQPPFLAITKPGRDMQATSLEEITAEVRAEDDYGVDRVDLVYSVNGAPADTVVMYAGRGNLRQFSGGHTLYLEEFDLQPGDLISYFARTSDASGLEGHNATSDIYFLEIRPFDRDFTQADAAGQPGQAGPTGSELSTQQRQIIAATFKLIRDRKQYSPDEWAENLQTVALSQGRLREEALRLAERMVNRGVAGLDSNFALIAEYLPNAADEMGQAEELLGERDPDEALAPEQRALQLLQRAEALFTDVQVAQNQNGGGGGGGEISEELADLFELELDRLSNQYEEVQRGAQQQVDQQIDETLERLRELARRQQQENERMRARAQSRNQSGSAGSSGQSQRQLAEEAEQLARQLERLSREESLPDMAETARQLREAAEAMRRAAAQSESGGEALGSEALDQLRDARRKLERNRAGRLERDTEAALNRTRRLLEQQQRVRDRVEQLDPTDQTRYRENLQAINRAKEQMAAEVNDLEQSLDRMSRESRRDQPEAARALDEAARSIRDNQVREKLLYTRGVVQQRSKEYALNFEDHITGTLQELAERLEQASGAIGEDSEDRIRQALEQTRDVVRSLESIGDRLAQDERARAAQPGNPQQAEPQQGEQQGQRQEDGAAQAEGNAEGDPNQANPQAAIGSGRLRPQDLRQLRGEIGRRAEQLEELRDQLREEGLDAEDLDRIIRRLEQLGSGASLGADGSAELLDRDVVQGLKEFEFALRRAVDDETAERILELGDGEVPEEYEDLVAEYYKRLAEQQ